MHCPRGRCGRSGRSAVAVLRRYTLRCYYAGRAFDELRGRTGRASRFCASCSVPKQHGFRGLGARPAPVILPKRGTWYSLLTEFRPTKLQLSGARPVAAPSRLSRPTAGRAMTSPMKNSRSQLDLDKTLIKAKPVTSQNRVLGAPRARHAAAARASRPVCSAESVARGSAAPCASHVWAHEAGCPMRSDRRWRLPRQPPGGLPDCARRPCACCASSGAASASPQCPQSPSRHFG